MSMSSKGGVTSRPASFLSAGCHANCSSCHGRGYVEGSYPGQYQTCFGATKCQTANETGYALIHFRGDLSGCDRTDCRKPFVRKGLYLRHRKQHDSEPQLNKQETFPQLCKHQSGSPVPTSYHEQISRQDGQSPSDVSGPSDPEAHSDTPGIGTKSASSSVVITLTTPGELETQICPENSSCRSLYQNSGSTDSGYHSGHRSSSNTPVMLTTTPVMVFGMSVAKTHSIPDSFSLSHNGQENVQRVVSEDEPESTSMYSLWTSPTTFGATSTPVPGWRSPDPPSLHELLGDDLNLPPSVRSGMDLLGMTPPSLMPPDYLEVISPNAFSKYLDHLQEQHIHNSQNDKVIEMRSISLTRRTADFPNHQRTSNLNDNLKCGSELHSSAQFPSRAESPSQLRSARSARLDQTRLHESSVAMMAEGREQSQDVNLWLDEVETQVEDESLAAGIECQSIEPANTISRDFGTPVEFSSGRSDSMCFQSEGEASFVLGEDPALFAKDDESPEVRALYVSLAEKLVTAFFQEANSPTDGAENFSQTGSATTTSGHRGSNTTASSTNTLLTSSSSLARKRPASGDDDQDGSKRAKRPMVTSPPPTGSEAKPLACPYSKFDPQRYSGQNVTELNYRKCSTSLLRDIPRVKQHLFRVHSQPEHHCPTCFSSFDTKAAANSHIVERSCEQQPSPFDEKMTPDQFTVIKRRVNRRDRVAGWNDIFRILFPNAILPLNPYIESVHSETIQEFYAFFYRAAPDFLRDELNTRLFGYNNDAPPEHQQWLEQVLGECVSVMLRRIDEQYAQDPPSDL